MSNYKGQDTPPEGLKPGQMLGFDKDGQRIGIDLPAIKFVCSVPSKVLGICTHKERLIVALETGVYELGADNVLRPLQFEAAS